MKNIKVGTTVILPGHQMVRGMKKCFETFCLQHTSSDGLPIGLTNDAFPRILTALYQDAFERTAHWTTIKDADANYHRLMGELVTHWSQLTTQFQEQFYREVIDPVIVDVMDQLDELGREEDRWRIWYVKLLGSDILIEKGPDFRVVDWERRMEQGIEYLKLKEEGEEVPATAWIPEGDCLMIAKRRRERQ